MTDSEALLQMAADYRRRAEALKNPEQRARKLALAEYCERAGAGMVRRPGMGARLWEAIVRATRRGRIAARTDWRRRLRPARDASAMLAMPLVAISAIGCSGIGVGIWLGTTSRGEVPQTPATQAPVTA